MMPYSLATAPAKTFAVTVNRVLVPVVSPGDGPVVAIVDGNSFGMNGEVCDNLAGRILLCQGWASQQNTPQGPGVQVDNIWGKP